MANRRRDSRGRFISSGRRSSRARGRRGMGSVYAVKRKKSGMGALSSDVFMTNVLPILVGIGVTGGTVLAIRKWVSPMDSTRMKTRKYSPLIGAGAGVVAGLSLKWLADDDAALTAVISSALTGGFLMVSDKMGLPLNQGPAAETTVPAAMEATANGTAGYLGMGAIVPEYSNGTNGMGAIVMTPMSGNQRPGSIGSYGETVSLSGINTNVFGTPGF